MIEFFFAGLPIMVLVILMTKRNPLPAPVAFLLGALCALLVRLIYFGTEVPAPECSRRGRTSGSPLRPFPLFSEPYFFFVALEISEVGFHECTPKPGSAAFPRQSRSPTDVGRVGLSFS